MRSGCGHLAGLFLLPLAVACTPGEDSEGPPAGVHRLRSLALLEAARDTSEGYIAAAAAIDEALRVGGRPQELLNLARVCCLADNWTPGVDRREKAWDALQRFRQANAPADVPAAVLYLEGLVLKHQGLIVSDQARLRAAAERFRAVTDEEPGVAAAWFQLGSALLETKDYRGAVDALKKVVELDSTHLAAHYKTYRAYVFLKDAEQTPLWQKKFEALQATAGRVKETHYEKCRFTRLSLAPERRGNTEPEPVALAFESLDLPAEIHGFSGRGVTFLTTTGGGHASVCVFGDAGLRLLRPREGRVDVVEARGLQAKQVRAVLTADYNNDGAIDVLVVQDGGVVALHRGDPEVSGRFERLTDVGLDLRQVVAARWMDYDHDGDVDLIVVQGERRLVPRVYRNNGDESFARQEGLLPAAVQGRAPFRFAAVDLDVGNDIDFVFPDVAGDAVAFLNLRRGPFRALRIPSLKEHSRIISLDLDGDGDMDLVGAPRAGGVPLRIAWSGGARRTAELPEFVVESPASLTDLPPVHDLDAADLDNDGDLDLVLASDHGLLLLRNRGGGSLELVEGPFSATAEHAWRSVRTADFDLDGLLDVAAVRGDGRLFLLRGSTPNPYLAISLRLKGRRDNRLGIGTHVEVYRGELYQRRLVDGATRVWLGLGTRDLGEFDGLTLVWPNGVTQGVSPEEYGGRVLEVEQPPGLMVSCPFLYTFDGERYRFLTDVVSIAPLDEWLPPGKAPHLDPEEYVRIPGDALAVRDGTLRAAITEELRETTYLDRVRLIRILHPKGTRVHADESTRQGGVEPLRVFVMDDAGFRTPPGVRADSGESAGDLVERLDRRYFRAFNEGPSQWAGWVERFTVEVELPSDLPRTSPALLLTGRIAWQDSGVAYALHQHGRTWSGHRLDVLDANRVKQSTWGDVGYPAGMDRTIVVPLEGALGASSRFLALSSNSRLFWDRIALVDEVASCELADEGESRVALGAREVVLRTEILALRRAKLGRHGFSRALGDVALHEQVYDHAAAGPWRGFPVPRGRATRYGDVLDLVGDVDDRLVVIPPGDGIELDFTAPAAASKDQTVTYFLRVTGWAKESGFHNRTGRRIEPIPFASMASYPEGALRPPRNAAYREYLDVYQTRAVGVVSE